MFSPRPWLSLSKATIVIIKAAAVSDRRVREAAPHRLRREGPVTLQSIPDEGADTIMLDNFSIADLRAGS